jgi:hypothetical protein
MSPFSGRDAYHEMMEMILGFWVSQTIRTIADWSLADHLATGALTAGEIARREGAAVETTVGLLRAGVGLGLMTVSADDTSTGPKGWPHFAPTRPVPYGQLRCASSTLSTGSSHFVGEHAVPRHGVGRETRCFTTDSAVQP